MADRLQQVEPQPDRERSMAQQHTHEFDCPSCGAHLDSREELNRHNRANHPAATPSSEVRSAGGGSSTDQPPSAPSNPSDRRS
jgi:hypothetical protein